MLKAMDAPASVYPAESLPHDWLFQRVSAIVHHGGFGTTAAGLRSGVPAVVIPHIIDQYYWGQRVHELGVGPKFITRGKLTAGNLAEAIHQALQDLSMRSRAADLGRSIRGEPDGVMRAVTYLEQCL